MGGRNVDESSGRNHGDRLGRAAGVAMERLGDVLELDREVQRPALRVADQGRGMDAERVRRALDSRLLGRSAALLFAFTPGVWFHASRAFTTT